MLELQRQEPMTLERFSRDVVTPAMLRLMELEDTVQGREILDRYVASLIEQAPGDV